MTTRSAQAIMTISLETLIKVVNEKAYMVGSIMQMEDGSWAASVRSWRPVPKAELRLDPKYMGRDSDYIYESGHGETPVDALMNALISAENDRVS